MSGERVPHFWPPLPEVGILTLVEVGILTLVVVGILTLVMVCIPQPTECPELHVEFVLSSS